MLDFKIVVTADPKDVAKDVTAFANRAGGVLIYGIRDNGDVAGEACPVDLDERAVVDQYRRRLAQASRPDVPGVEVIPKPRLLGEKEGLSLVLVPPSPLAPHAIWDNKMLRFSWRVGRNSVPMLESDLERLYRQRWSFQESFRKRMRDLGRSTDETFNHGLVELVAVPLVQQRVRDLLAESFTQFELLQQMTGRSMCYGSQVRAKHRRIAPCVRVVAARCCATEGLV